MKGSNYLTEEEIESYFEMSRLCRPSLPDDKPVLTDEELEQLITEVITKQ